MSNAAKEKSDDNSSNQAIRSANEEERVLITLAAINQHEVRMRKRRVMITPAAIKQHEV